MFKGEKFWRKRRLRNRSLTAWPLLFRIVQPVIYTVTHGTWRLLVMRQIFQKAAQEKFKESFDPLNE